MANGRLMLRTWALSFPMEGERPSFLTAVVEPLRTGLVFVLRVVLGGVLLLSGLLKLQQPYDFLHAVYDYQLLGPETGLGLALVLPWLEVLVGASLIAGKLLEGAFLLSSVLAGVFVLVQTIALARGLEIPCGCFAASSPELISLSTIARAAGMFLGSAAGFALVLPRETSLGKYGNVRAKGG